MSTHDNAPPPADWVCDPRGCPFPGCDICATDTVTIPANIQLADN